jgi:hypothetical protein
MTLGSRSRSAVATGGFVVSCDHGPMSRSGRWSRIVVDLAEHHDPAELAEAQGEFYPFGLFTSLDFSPDASWLFVGACCRLHLVETATGRVHAQQVFFEQLAGGDSVFDPLAGSVRLREVRQGADGACCVSMDFDPPPGNTGIVVCQLVGPGLDLITPVGDPEHAILVPKSPNPLTTVLAIAVAESAGLVAIAETDYDHQTQQLSVFRVRDGKPVHTLAGFEHGDSGMDLDPLGKRLAVLESFQDIAIYDVRSGRREAGLTLDGCGEVDLLRFNRDGRRLWAATIDPAVLVDIDLTTDPPQERARLQVGTGRALRPQCLARSGAAVWAPTEPVDLTFYTEFERRIAAGTTHVMLADPQRGVRAHPVAEHASQRRLDRVTVSSAGDVIAYTLGTEVIIEPING